MCRLLDPASQFAGKSLDLKGVSFVTAAGLRGALSLMLLRTVILVPWVTAGGAFDQDALLIQAQMVIWGAAFVFFTLVGQLHAILSLSDSHFGSDLYMCRNAALTPTFLHHRW